MSLQCQLTLCPGTDNNLLITTKDRYMTWVDLIGVAILLQSSSELFN